MIKAVVDDKKDKIKVVLKGEGLDIINELINLFAGISANVINRVYNSDLNQMTQMLDKVLDIEKSVTLQKMADIVEKGGK